MSSSTQNPIDLLPHRPPFLFVDEVLHLDGHSIEASRRVPVDEPWSEAHFPDRPIVPGVLLIEGMAQTAGLLIRLTARSTPRAEAGVLGEVVRAKFLRQVSPGDELVYRARRMMSVGTVTRFACSTLSRGVTVAEAEITLSLR